MKLDFYLWKNKIKIKDFSQDLGMSVYQLSLVQHREANPSILAAIMIHLKTNGEVSLMDLLKETDSKKLQNYLKKNNKTEESIKWI